MESLRRWFLLLRIPTAIALVFVFFAFYNRFLVDANLRNLQTSLSILDRATGVGQAEAALLLVDQTLVAQMAQEELDLRTLSTLQYVQGALATDRLQRPVDDAQVMIATLAEDQAASRPALLKTLDRMALGFQGALQRANLLPRQMLSGAGLQQMDPARQAQASQLEGSGRFSEAARLYEELLRDYPRDKKRTGVKLRLAYLHQRLQEFDEAGHLYQEVLRESVLAQEIQTARQALLGLAGIRAKREQVQKLRKALAQALSPPERQQTAFSLGSALLETYSFPEAAEAFHQAFTVDPEGPLALPCLFKEGWILKRLGRFDDAFVCFQELIRRGSGTGWAAAAYQQMAETYKAAGDPKTAAELYEQIIQKSEDAEILAITRAQVGSIYLYDLQAPAKAEFHFQALSQSYPASAFGAVQSRLAEIQQEKGTPQVRPTAEGAASAQAALPMATAPAAAQLTAGTPLMSWLERFLPLFVDVFTTRLARYMRESEVKEISRRFSEEEFRALVVRRVQEQFPGQVKDVTAQIRQNGFIGSGVVKLGIVSVAVKARVGIVVKNERPHTVIHEIHVGAIPMPESLRKFLEERTNQTIGRAKYPLKIKEYELRDGYAQISVELAQ